MCLISGNDGQNVFDFSLLCYILFKMGNRSLKHAVFNMSIGNNNGYV